MHYLAKITKGEHKGTTGSLACSIEAAYNNLKALYPKNKSIKVYEVVDCNSLTYVLGKVVKE